MQLVIGYNSISNKGWSIIEIWSLLGVEVSPKRTNSDDKGVGSWVSLDIHKTKKWKSSNLSTKQAQDFGICTSRLAIRLWFELDFYLKFSIKKFFN